MAMPHPQCSPVSTGVSSHTHTSYLPDGTVLGRYGRAVHRDTRDVMGNGKGDAQRRNAHVPRQALRESLLAPLAPGTVRWGRALQRYEVDDDGVTLHFRAGAPAERASLLVGADGIWSSVQIALANRAHTHATHGRARHRIPLCAGARAALRRRERPALPWGCCYTRARHVSPSPRARAGPTPTADSVVLMGWEHVGDHGRSRASR